MNKQYWLSSMKNTLCCQRRTVRAQCKSHMSIVTISVLCWACKPLFQEPGSRLATVCRLTLYPKTFVADDFTVRKQLRRVKVRQYRYSQGVATLNMPVHACSCLFATREQPKVLAISKKGTVLFNDALNTFYLRLYDVGHMVKDHSNSERRNPLPPHGVLFPISSK